MSRKYKELQRWAIVARDGGKVIVIKNMRHGYEPTAFDPGKYDTVKVAGDPRRVLSSDVQAGMIRKGDSFEWPGGMGHAA